MKKYPPIGPISSDTLRPDDLIPKFHAWLKEYDPEGAAKIRECYSAVFECLEAGEDLDGEDALWCIDDLEDALTNIAPPYAYFGASEGDGACFGWWVYPEDIMGDVEARVIIHAETWDPINRGRLVYSGDAESGTLYDEDGDVIWSV